MCSFLCEKMCVVFCVRLCVCVCVCVWVCVCGCMRVWLRMRLCAGVLCTTSLLLPPPPSHGALQHRAGDRRGKISQIVFVLFFSARLSFVSSVAASNQKQNLLQVLVGASPTLFTQTKRGVRAKAFSLAKNKSKIQQQQRAFRPNRDPQRLCKRDPPWLEEKKKPTAVKNRGRQPFSRSQFPGWPPGFCSSWPRVVGIQGSGNTWSSC